MASVPSAGADGEAERRKRQEAKRRKRQEAKRRKAEQLAARRSNLMQAGIPVYCRYDDLVAGGYVTSWTQLGRMIDEQGFPPGTMIGPNTRAWALSELKAWLTTRPSARKVMPPGAVHPRVRDNRRAAEAETASAIEPDVEREQDAEPAQAQP